MKCTNGIKSTWERERDFLGNDVWIINHTCSEPAFILCVYSAPDLECFIIGLLVEGGYRQEINGLFLLPKEEVGRFKYFISCECIVLLLRYYFHFRH